MKTCLKCTNPVDTRGLCKVHYNRAYRESLRVNRKHHVNCVGERLVVPVQVPGWGCRV